MTIEQQILDGLTALLGRRTLTQSEFQSWWTGPADGGPAGDGLYPMTDASGFVRKLPSPAKIQQLGGSGSAAMLVDLASRGILLAGEAGQVDKLVPLIAAARADQRQVLAARGLLLLDRQLDLSSCSFDLMALKLRCAPGLGPFLGTIIGVPIQNEDGTTTTPTMSKAAVEIGGKLAGGNNEWGSKRLYIDGNRAQNGQAFTAVSLTGDQGGMNQYEVAVVNHNGNALEIRGDCEKKDVRLYVNNIDGAAVRIMPDVTAPTASPDELALFIQGNNVQQAYISHPGLQTSTTVQFNLEQMRPLPGRAAVEVGGGKTEVFSGELRGCTGNGFLVHRGGDRSSSGGADVTFDNSVFVQFYDGYAMRLVNPKNVAGAATFRVNEDRPTAGATAGQPALIIQSCHRGYSAHFHLDRIKKAVGVQIGDIDSPDGELKAMIGHYIPLTIEMGDDTTPAHGYTAVRVNAARDCLIDTTTKLQGNIAVDAGASGCTQWVKADWVRAGYTITVSPLATYELRITTLIASHELFDRPWLFSGVVAEAVSDLGGLPYRYNGTSWEPMAPLSVSGAVLGGSASLLNQRIKRRGAVAVDTDSALTYVAQGPAPTDPWRAGQTIVVPGYTTMLTDYEARVAAAGGAAFPAAWRDAVDRALIDLVDKGLWTPGAIVTSKVKTLAILCNHSLPAALVNPLFADLNPAMPVPMDFIQWHGITGDGVGEHLDFGWNMQTSPRGVTLDSLHLGATAEEDSDDPTYDIGGSLTSWGVRAHRADGGSTIRMGVSVGTTLDHAPMPRSVIGVRAAGGSFGYSSGGIAAVSNPAAATVALPTALYGMRAQTTYSKQRLSILHAGAGLTPADAGALLAIIGQLRRAAARIAG